MNRRIKELNKAELVLELKDSLREIERLKRVVKVRDMALESKANHELLTGAWL